MKKTLEFGSLFAGIGGFDLGFERAGLKCKWQVEIDEFCNMVLSRHWPKVERIKNIKSFLNERNYKRYIIDVLCGGFPCQDISNAGRREGINGKKSGLWHEFAGCIRLLRPRVVVVENVDALPIRGLEKILTDFHVLGYDAGWSPVSACAMGAPHPRERLFVVAYSNRIKQGQRRWEQFEESCKEAWNLCQWPRESEPVRMADGIPHRLDRNRCLGNTVMPQITEMIGRSLHVFF